MVWTSHPWLKSVSQIVPTCMREVSHGLNTPLDGQTDQSGVGLVTDQL